MEQFEFFQNSELEQKCLIWRGCMVCRHMLSHRGPRAWTVHSGSRAISDFDLIIQRPKLKWFYFDLAHAVLPQSKAYHKYTTGLKMHWPQGEILTLFCSDLNCSGYICDRDRPQPGLWGSVTDRAAV